MMASLLESEVSMRVRERASEGLNLVSPSKGASFGLALVAVSTASSVPTWVLMLEIACLCAAQLLSIPAVERTLATVVDAVSVRWLADGAAGRKGTVVALSQIVFDNSRKR